MPHNVFIYLRLGGAPAKWSTPGKWGKLFMRILITKLLIIILKPTKNWGKAVEVDQAATAPITHS